MLWAKVQSSQMYFKNSRCTPPTARVPSGKSYGKIYHTEYTHTHTPLTPMLPRLGLILKYVIKTARFVVSATLVFA